MSKPKRLPRLEFQARGYDAVRTPLFSLKVKKNDDKGTRIGVVVGKSVEKTAVKRNFWKRQARAILQSVCKGNYDVMLVVQPGVRASTRKQFREALEKSLRNGR
jgi:ribonuclease P protein component